MFNKTTYPLVLGFSIGNEGGIYFLWKLLRDYLGISIGNGGVILPLGVFSNM